MRIDERLSQALREEAESRDVDVPRLWAATQDRLDEQPRHPRRFPALTAAAAAVAVVAGVAGLTQADWSGDNGPAGPDTSGRSAVDDEFTCAHQTTYDWTDPGVRRDGYYVPTLFGGPQHQAETYDASRFEFEKTGDQAFLRLGNADGTLALVTELHRQDGKWDPVRTRMCTGPNGSVMVPVRGEWSLENHGGEPHDASDLGISHARTAYLVDDRTYYDGAGLVRHRTLYAHACRKTICLTSANRTGSSGTSLPPGSTPRDVSRFFLPPDEQFGRTERYGLWALYDVDGEVSGLTAKLRDGREVTAQGAFVDSRRGQVYLLLAPFEQVETVTVHPRPHSSDPGARPETYTPQQLAGPQDGLLR